MSILTRLNLIISFSFYLSISKAFGVQAKYYNDVLTPLWLSNSYDINPLVKNRFIFHSNISTGRYKNDIYFYPDFAFGLKVSKNLALTTNIFVNNFNKNSSQIVGVGTQYFFGSNDSLEWVSSLKKVNVKVLKSFFLSNTALDISRWFYYKNLFSFSLFKCEMIDHFELAKNLLENIKRWTKWATGS